MAFRVYVAPGHAAITVAYQMMNGVHRTNLFLDAELDIGVYAYPDIHEAIAKFEELGSERPVGVIGIVIGTPDRSDWNCNWLSIKKGKGDRSAGNSEAGADHFIRTKVVHIGWL